MRHSVHCTVQSMGSTVVHCEQCIDAEDDDEDDEDEDEDADDIDENFDGAAPSAAFFGFLAYFLDAG